MKIFSEEQLSSYEDNISKGCKQCCRDKNCLNPRMRVNGRGQRSVLIVGDYPGEQDDQLGKPFMGDANVNFLDLLRGKGCNPLNDFYFTNAINCRKESKDGSTVPPTDTEIKLCRPYLESIIEELRPNDIIILSDVSKSYAIKSFFPFIEKPSTDMFRGMSIPDQKLRTWLHTTISPKTIEQRSFDKNLFSVYNRDLNAILKRLGRPVPEYPEPRVDMLLSINQIIGALEYITDRKAPCYIDYETTGLKPYYNGHRIVSMSIAYHEKGATTTVSFPFQYRNLFTPEEQNKIKYHIKKFLVSGIALSAHNLKFEDSWSRNIIKMRPKNWFFDTQLAAHILDNRTGITGLKNQVYYHFGVRPYNEHIQPLLVQEEGSEFNRVDDIPLKDLLKYGGLDSAYGSMLKDIQSKELERRNLLEPYKFFHQGNLVLSNMEQKGVHMDEEYYHEQKKVLADKILHLEQGLLESPEARKFRKQTGKNLDLAANKDMSELFYDVLKHKKAFTAKGNLSIDKLTLDKIDTPFVKNLLYMRKLVKAKDTYFAQFIREIYNSRMNPFFNLNIPVSYRSSSSQPNFQNIPTRDEETKRIIRSGVKASPGRRLLFWDGKGMEVCTSVCYHQDPNMIKYVTDPSTDMHRDTAADIWMLPHDEVTKDIRFYAKNSWVFAEFYGSYYMDCGTTLWETCIQNLDLKTKSGVPLKQHLLDVGISSSKNNGAGNKDQFLEHCKEVERIFWKERFKVYDKWKWEINEEYKQNGFITTKMGFVFGGIMNRKQVSNYPIQGTAFHLLLWSLIEIEKIAVKERWKSELIAQIHDEGVMDAVPGEIPHIIETAKHIVEVKMPKTFPWINVPFGIDVSATPINGSWYEKGDL